MHVNLLKGQILDWELQPFKELQSRLKIVKKKMVTILKNNHGQNPMNKSFIPWEPKLAKGTMMQ